MADYEPVLRTEDLGPGEVEEVEAQGATLALINLGQIYYVFEAQCPTDGTNLAREGTLENELLVCPNDDSAFDVRTGEAVRPADGPSLERYTFKIQENEISIGPPASAESKT